MTSSVRFTEEMLGHVTFGETDFARGAQPDRDGSAGFKFHLTIEVEDIESFRTTRCAPPPPSAGSSATRSAAGCRSSRAGSTCSWTSSRASSTCSTGSGSATASGNPLTMTGFKLVKDDAGFDVWKDTTTLFTRILQGHVPEGGDETASRARLRNHHHPSA